MKPASLMGKSRFDKKLWQYLAVFAVDIAVIFVVLFYKNIISVMRLMPICPIYAIGLRCATCGGTRCVSALLRLDILSALRLNFPVVLFCIYCAVTLFFAHICLFTEKSTPTKLFLKLFSGKAAIFWAIFFAVYTVIRNISLLAFHFEF